MGYDVSYHPISPAQMKLWYFDRLNDPDFSQGEAIGKKAGMKDFYIEKYKETLRAAQGTDPQACFDLSHSYYLAVVQGFFSTFYYTRGTAFSFLLERNPQLSRYIQPWPELWEPAGQLPLQGRITQNYSGGVFLPYEKLKQFREDYGQDPSLKNMMDDFYGDNITVFGKAVDQALEQGLGLLEATEVVEPNPTNLNATICYSDLFHCDKEGVFIFQKNVLAQIAPLAQEQNLSPEEFLSQFQYQKREVPPAGQPAPPKPSPSPQPTKKSFWRKLFGKS